LVAPIVMVVLFAGRLARHQNSTWIFGASLAYALLGIVPISYNSFGLDGTGAQLFFFAPVRVRDVLLAKNILNSVLAVVDVAVILGVIIYLVGVPPLPVLLGGVLWTAMTLLIETTLGNYRSINTPRKIDLTRTAQKQASPLSALLSMGILLLTAA
ncbi:MAG: hypothetical protein PW735_04150, partial [Acidobacteriaceae bacterium]|nr:hypothetical protein [Acidobacteriaceae bacterium]